MQMRRHLPFIIYLALLSLLSGWLMAHMSWIGRVGIRWMHREYSFLKVWYKGAAVVFAVLLGLHGIGALAKQYFSNGGARLYFIICLSLAAGGLYFTYLDFRRDFTHHILKENFHLGAYLFWAGWMSSSLFYLAIKKRDYQSLR